MTNRKRLPSDTFLEMHLRENQERVRAAFEGATKGLQTVLDEFDELVECRGGAWPVKRVVQWCVSHALESAVQMIVRALQHEKADVTADRVWQELDAAVRGRYIQAREPRAAHWDAVDWHVLTALKHGEFFEDVASGSRGMERSERRTAREATEFVLSCLGLMVDDIEWACECAQGAGAK
jgi:hypothetical protein